jgi:hypothetical protein
MGKRAIFVSCSYEIDEGMEVEVYKIEPSSGRKLLIASSKNSKSNKRRAFLKLKTGAKYEIIIIKTEKSGKTSLSSAFITLDPSGRIKECKGDLPPKFKLF